MANFGGTEVSDMQNFAALLNAGGWNTGGGGGGASFSAENKQGATIRAGQLVAIHSSGTGVVLANASNTAKDAIGAATADAANGAACSVKLTGHLNLADWTNVVGSANLAAKAPYYLDTVDGKISTAPPSIAGQVVQKVGESLSLTTLKIEIEPLILL